MLEPLDLVVFILMTGACLLNCGLLVRRMWYCRRTKNLETHYRSYISVILSDIMLSLHACIFLPLGVWYGRDSSRLCEISTNLFVWITYYNFLSVFPLTVDRIFGVFIPFRYKSGTHMSLAWVTNLFSLGLPSITLLLYHIEKGDNTISLYIPAENQPSSGTCLITSWVHISSLTNHLLVKFLIFSTNCFVTLAVYVGIIIKLKVRGICKEHDKCTKMSIRTMTMGLFTISSWLPTIVVRNIVDSQDTRLIKATQNIFYLNAIFDPVVYIFVEKLLSFISCLNPWKVVGVDALDVQSSQRLEMPTIRANKSNIKTNSSIMRSADLFVIPEVKTKLAIESL